MTNNNKPTNGGKESNSEGFWIDKKLRGVVLVSKPDTLRYPAEPYFDNEKKKFTGTFYMPPGHPDYFDIGTIIGDMAAKYGDDVIHNSITNEDVKAYFFKDVTSDKFYKKLGVSSGEIIKINASEQSPPCLFSKKDDGYSEVGDFYPLVMSETLKNGKTVVDLDIGIALSYFSNKNSAEDSYFLAYTRLLSVYIKYNLSTSLYSEKASNLEELVISETGMMLLNEEVG